MKMKELAVIGSVEPIAFPALGFDCLHARVDTGAKTNSIWASSIRLHEDRLEVIFLGPGHPDYSGKKVIFDSFEQVAVANSSGHAELRFKVRTTMVIAGRRIRARLTLADRSSQTYPVLVGRNVLRGKFIVDVRRGSPQKEAEGIRSAQLRAQFKNRSAK